jgi:pyruvate/2-oxoglutarate dehydrogenase complex dihydrolipoamide dehydrogenase (E3) component
MTTSTYDAIVIGSGQAGGPLSITLAEAGWKTALIERTHVGGTCINEGCTPTKTMIASARVAYLARRSTDYGVHTGPVTVDMTKVRKRKRDIVDSFRASSQRRIEQTPGLDLLMGEARFIATKTLEVHLKNGTVLQLSANTIFINVGDRPAKLSIPGIEHIQVLDSTSIMELDNVPEHLMIVGGGYVGLEFGQMFRRFGSQVTIIQRGERLLSREDTDVAEEVTKIMREDGIEVLLEMKPVYIKRSSNGNIQMTLQTPTGEPTITGTHLLAAAGRVPNSDSLNLAAAGVQTDKHGYIQVNDQLETNVPGIYALGDVKGGPAFTHISYDDFRVIRTNLLEKGNASIRNRLVPNTIFIDPQLGRVGLSETEARAQNRNIKVAKMPMNYVARALEVGESRGFMKVVVDAHTGRILGCAILGIEGGEIMAMLEIAIMGQLPYTVLRDAIFAHPTLAESLNNLFSTFN